MYPVLFEFGPLKVYTWGLMVGIGILMGLWVVLWKAREAGIDTDKVVNLVLASVLAGILGARIAYVILFWSYYGQHPMEILWISGGGLTVYGAILAVIPTLIWLTKKWKIPVWKFMDIAVLGMWPGYAIGRIGCFFNGCCQGFAHYGFLGFHFPQYAEPRLATQLISSGIAAILFVIFLFVVYPRKKFDGQVFFYAIGTYMAYRFGIEFFRDNPNGPWNLTVGQWTIIAVVPIFLYWYTWFKKKFASGS